MIVSVIEPLSTVQLAPISTPSSKITFPIWGVLIFFCLTGIKPKPLMPILEPSFMCTQSSIIEYFKDNDLPLLLIDFENDENIVEKICDFLNIEKVDVEVPWANKEGCYQDPGLWKRLNNIKE